MITTYTTAASIRAILGVADDELEDAVITDAVYDTLLTEDLLELSANLPADYAIVKALPSPSPTQTRFLNLTNTWVAFDVASKLLTSIEMFAPKTIKSDKDELTRIDDPYAKLRANITSTMSVLATRLLALYAILYPANPAPAAVDLVNVVVVGVGTDPVTG